MSGALQALGWTLIHFCWQATAVAVLYQAADLWFKKAHSRIRYLLTLATLSLMFLAFVATLGYETMRSFAITSLQVSHSSTPTLATSPMGAFTAQVELLANQPVALPLTSLLPWLDGAWILGVLCLSMRSFGGWWWLQRLRRTAMDEAPEAIQASFRKVCAKLGIARLPELRISENIPGPMTIGVLRTFVLLPVSAVLALSPEQLEAIFAHELAHVRRADYFWNLVQMLAETLFFFHPTVWWLGKQLREQRELCCDDIAIETCSDPLIYATALFRLEDQRVAGLNLAMALDGHQSRNAFRSRILRILGATAPQSPSARLLPLSLFAVCISLFFFLSPLPKALGGIAAQNLPVKQMLAMPTEIAHATKHLALQSTRSTSAPRKVAERQDAVEVSGSSTLNPTTVLIAKSTSDDFEYEEQMRALGYDVDYGQYTVMQNAAITPAYAKEMADLGFGKPSVGTLLELRKQNITREYLTTMRAAGLQPRGFDELISYRLFDITQEFIAGMKAAGFDSIPTGKLRALRAVGVTPEYAKAVKQRFPNATIQDLIQSRVQQADNDTADLPKNIRPPAFIPPTESDPPPHRRRPPGPPWQTGQGESPPPLMQ